MTLWLSIPMPCFPPSYVSRTLLKTLLLVKGGRQPPSSVKQLRMVPSIMPIIPTLALTHASIILSSWSYLGYLPSSCHMAPPLWLICLHCLIPGFTLCNCANCICLSPLYQQISIINHCHWFSGIDILFPFLHSTKQLSSIPLLLLIFLVADSNLPWNSTETPQS